MTEGTTYTVIDCFEYLTLLGGIYLTYELQAEDSDQVLHVGNGHMVLAAA
jgi:lipid-A-disaccharide synthase-like uncharacterized protein